MYLFPIDPKYKHNASRTAYIGDSGTDIGCPMYTLVVSVGDATVIYAEYGHTKWTTPPDTAYSVKLKLDNPIQRNGKSYPYVFYTHMSNVVSFKPKQKINAGKQLGISGMGNRVPHLHISFAVDSQITDYIESLDGQNMMWDEWKEKDEEDMLTEMSPTFRGKGVAKYSGLWTGPDHPGLDEYRGNVWLDLNVLRDQAPTEINIHMIDKDDEKISRKRTLEKGKSTGLLLNQYIQGSFRLVVTTPDDEPFDITVKQFFVRG